MNPNKRSKKPKQTKNSRKDLPPDEAGKIKKTLEEPKLSKNSNRIKSN